MILMVTLILRLYLPIRLLRPHCIVAKNPYHQITPLSDLAAATAARAANVANESVIKSLKSEVNNLNETVNQLTTQIQMLSAALGLTSSTISAASQPQQTSAVPANAETSRKSYAAAAKPGMVQQMHCNSVSAVYVDLEQRKKRANNVVINGLTNDENFDDSLKL